MSTNDQIAQKFYYRNYSELTGMEKKVVDHEIKKARELADRQEKSRQENSKDYHPIHPDAERR